MLSWLFGMEDDERRANKRDLPLGTIAMMEMLEYVLPIK